LRTSFVIIALIALIAFFSIPTFARSYDNGYGTGKCNVCGFEAKYELYRVTSYGFFSDSKEYLIGEYCEKHKWVGESVKNFGFLGSIVEFMVILTNQIIN
jgi:lysozyme family protein